MPLFRRRPPLWDDTTPDEELVRLWQHGHRDAFGVLFDRHHSGIFIYCFRMLGDRDSAEDARSITFTNAFRALSGFRPAVTEGAFRRWLYTIAHHVIADDLRTRRRTISLDIAQEFHDPSPSPEDRAIVADQWIQVMALLPQLSIDQGHEIALRMSGLDAVEIAEVLGRPRNAIDGIHHRALIRLRGLVATGSESIASGGERRD